MKVAISTDGDYVSAHFGRCPFFTIVDIQGANIIKRDVINNPGHQPGNIPQFLHSQGVQCIIAGGMGMRAAGFFNDLGIQTIVGINGKIDDVLAELQKGTLKSKESLCRPGSGKGYGIEKTACDHPDEENCEH